MQNLSDFTKPDRFLLTSYSVLNAIRGFILINILNRRNIITEYFFLAFMLITAFFDLTLNPSPRFGLGY